MMKYPWMCRIFGHKMWEIGSQWGDRYMTEKCQRYGCLYRE